MKELKNVITILLGIIGVVVTNILILIYAGTIEALRKLNILKQIRKFCMKRMIIHMSLVVGVVKDLARRGFGKLSNKAQCDAQEIIHELCLLLESGNY